MLVYGCCSLRDNFSKVNLSKRNPMSKPKVTPSVTDPSHPVDYSKTETPPNYVCHTCGAGGCKLWREYQTMLDSQKLHCAPCAAKGQKKDISSIDARGHRKCESGGTTDQIGWLIPAVPTAENDTYWGYTSVPQRGCDWWARLPTLPNQVPAKVA